MPTQPLAGIKVLDLSRQFPGPYATMVLADFGADVLRIEDRRFLSDPSASIVMRNKRQMSLNLKTEAGKEIFFKLIAGADILVEGFRPDVTKRLGIGYEDLKRKKPDLIYCSLSGYGQTGPYRDMVGHDLNYISFAGILELCGEPDRKPVIPPVQIADVGGGLNAAIGILLALFHRERTGQGQYVDVALMDAALGFMQLNFMQFLDVGLSVARGRQPLTGLFPSYAVYETKDGKFFSLGAVEKRFWDAFCDRVARPDLKKDHWAVGARGEQVVAGVTALFKTRTRDEWFEEFKATDICVGKALALKEVMEDPQVQAREMVLKIDDHGKPRTLLGIVPKLSATPGDVRTPPATFGEHTEAVLKELGYSSAQIKELGKTGVI